MSRGMPISAIPSLTKRLELILFGLNQRLGAMGREPDIATTQFNQPLANSLKFPHTGEPEYLDMCG